jgi:hypothetical protein
MNRQFWKLGAQCSLVTLLGVLSQLQPAEAAGGFIESDNQASAKDLEVSIAILSNSESSLSLAINSAPVNTSEIEIANQENFVAQPLLASSPVVVGADVNSLEQVTSVNQLSDLKPTDWAYQAVQSLVERYGCIVGYPNSTFRGNRAATRFELAAALNACLDVISDRFATKEDLATLRRLQEEFAKELATLKGRVNGLEARTAKLEAQQFSTTTKLQGTATMSFQAGALGRQLDPVGRTLNQNLEIVPDLLPRDVNPTVIGAVILNLNTSFSGSDLLQTSLAFGNNGLDTIGAAGLGRTPNLPNLFPNGANPGPYFNPGQYYWSGFTTNVFLYRLAYTFKPFKDVTITAGPQFYPSDILDFNSYANAPASDFGSYFFINNPLIVPYSLNYAGGAGAAVQWNPGGGPITVKALYLAAGANLVTRNTAGDGIGGGFLGDPRQGSVEVQYASSFGGGKNNFAVRLQYTNSLTYNVGANAVGLNTELTLGRLGIFGRFGYAWIDSEPGFNPIPYSDVFPASDVLSNNFRVMTFMGGIAYKDLLVPGSLLAVAAGVPFKTIGQRDCCENPINDRDQVNLEAIYRFPVNDNITITPIFSVILNPNNSSANDTIYQGVLRTTFTF